MEHSPMMRLLSALLSCAALAAPCASQSVAPEGTFTPPPGWSRRDDASGVIEFDSPPRDSGQARIIIEPPRALGGRRIGDALKAWLTEGIGRRLELSFRHGVATGHTVHGQPAAWHDAQVRYRNTRDEARIVAIAIAHSDDTFSPVLFLAREEGSHYAQARLFGSWLVSAPLRGETSGVAWSPLAPPAPGPLAGLWMGSTSRNAINAFGGFDLVVDRYYVTLARTGFAYRDLPGEGMIDAPDAARLCAGAKRADCGAYRVQRDTLIVDWMTAFGLVETERTALEQPRDPDPLFYHDGAQMFRVDPVPAMTLNGEYTALNATVGPRGSVASTRSIRFYSDGRYESSSFAGVTAGGTESDPTPTIVASSQSRTPQRGTYEIRGYTLVLRPERGAVRRATLVILQPEKRPIAAIMIDDVDYRR
jgi:hypothetical protein